MATTRAIDLKTEIPGPRSREILDRKARVIAEPLSIYLPIVIEEAHGATITDVDGNTFIDFTGGVGCLNVGHSNPRVVEAAKDQIERFTHTDFTIIPYENYIALAERLLELVPIGGEKRAAFFNSGAEAVENAVKFARSYTRRPAVIAFDGGFHGRTLLALSLTSKTTTAGRLVYDRANLIAFSTASVPALKNAAFAGPANGETAIRRSASVT